MALVFTADQISQAEQNAMQNCKDRLRAMCHQAFGDDPETIDWFEAVWAQATGPLHLTDCPDIARFFNIQATSVDWAANPLHAAYVDAMLNDPYGGIAGKDGVRAVHQNIVEQHYMD